MDKIALIGAGLIGSGWGIVFAEAGRHPVLYDADPAAAANALAEIEKGLADLDSYGLIDEAPAV